MCITNIIIAFNFKEKKAWTCAIVTLDFGKIWKKICRDTFQKKVSRNGYQTTWNGLKRRENVSWKWKFFWKNIIDYLAYNSHIKPCMPPAPHPPLCTTTITISNNNIINNNSKNNKNKTKPTPTMITTTTTTAPPLTTLTKTTTTATTTTSPTTTTTTTINSTTNRYYKFQLWDFL